MMQYPVRPPFYRRYAAVLAGCLLLVSLSGCTESGGSTSRSEAEAVSPSGAAGAEPQRAPGASMGTKARFVDVAQAAGITYRWEIPGKRPLTILQTMGNGCAFLDYDNDGSLDILLIGPRLALYRGDGAGRFRDVTEAAGLAALSADFRGCAVGDYDNDGFDDVYVSAYRGGALLRNIADKRFEDVTKQAGIASQPWGSSCAFGDVNGDGRLDLYVGNYVQFGPASTQFCTVDGHKTACAPQHYDPEKGVLYLNENGARFKNATKSLGAAGVSGKALGVAIADYNRSGRQSIAIANDEVPGDLLQNTGKAFKNVGPESGTAYAGTGKPHGGMGIDWGDFNNDGRLDLTVTTFALEPKAVYVNEGDDLFLEQSTPLGIADPTYRNVAFGVKWLDFDNDGWLDLMIANGHTSDNAADLDNTMTYRQPTQLFQNEEGQRFLDRSAQAGADLQKPIVGRGLATGDYDNDGRVDALVVDSEGAPLLLHNETPDPGHYLSLTLIGAKSNRSALGATVMVQAGGRTLTRLCRTDGSYLSASDRRVHFGLGKSASPVTVTVRWPGSGRTEAYKDVAVDRQVTLREGATRNGSAAARRQ